LTRDAPDHEFHRFADERLWILERCESDPLATIIQRGELPLQWRRFAAGANQYSLPGTLKLDLPGDFCTNESERSEGLVGRTTKLIISPESIRHFMAIRSITSDNDKWPTMISRAVNLSKLGFRFRVRAATNRAGD
jgi:hypothetical protein